LSDLASEPVTMHKPTDFGNGLRAHLGLDAAQLELAAVPVAPPRQPVAELVEDEVGDRETDRLDALAELEAELLERERSLAAREASLASRAGSLLATAQALYDEVLGGGPAPHDDELSRLRRRKSVA
jgi:hypothetical protein